MKVNSSFNHDLSLPNGVFLKLFTDKEVLDDEDMKKIRKKFKHIKSGKYETEYIDGDILTRTGFLENESSKQNNQ